MENDHQYKRSLGISQRIRSPRKEEKNLGENLLGAFEGALPKGESSIRAVRKLREPRYG